jgi:hypothetical protein
VFWVHRAYQHSQRRPKKDAFFSGLSAKNRDSFLIQMR